MLFLGHEIWIEHPKVCRPGEIVDCLLKFGHHMKKDGCLDPCRASVLLAEPSGTRHRLGLCFDRTQPDGFVASFLAEQNGPHTLLTEYDGGVWTKDPAGRFCYGAKANRESVDDSKYYYLYSKAVVAVGAGEHCPEPVGCELEIVPETVKPFEAGDEFRFRLLYEGRPLPGEILAISGEKKSETHLQQKSEDPVSLSLDAAGVWLILAVHNDRAKGKRGEYGSRVIGTTLTLNLQAGERGGKDHVR